MNEMWLFNASMKQPHKNLLELAAREPLGKSGAVGDPRVHAGGNLWNPFRVIIRKNRLILPDV
jgi:hypothetical protein